MSRSSSCGGGEASCLRERVLAARSPNEELRVVERVLFERLVRPLERDPAIDFALRAFGDRSAALTVSDVIGELGISSKRFLKAFTKQVGLTPKRYLRVQRFQQTLVDLAARESTSWTDLALEAGYFDQAHFNHEFMAFSGVSPRGYEARRRQKNHLRAIE
jgi:AraC-like DNA-binding protein